MSDPEEEADVSPSEPEAGEGEEESVDLDAMFPADDGALDQDEIDDLFEITTDDEAARTGIEALLGHARVQHRRLPVLEACFGRLLKTLSGNLRNFMREQVEVSMADSTSQRYGDYVEAIPMPALIAVFKAVQWNGLGMITVDSPLIYSLIDVLLGGRRTSTSLDIEGRAFTSIETMLVERVIKIVLADMAAAFAPICDIAFEQESLETNPALISIAHPTATAIVFKIDVDMDDRGGRIEILIPDATLEPVRDLLQQGFMGDKFGHDQIWEDHWIGEMRLAEAEIEVTLGHRMMPLNDLLELDVGSTLTLNAKPGDLVTLTSGRVPLMRGRVGRVDEKVAIQVEEWIDPANRKAFKTQSG